MTHSINVKYIHEVEKRPLSLIECDLILEWRRTYGDLRNECIDHEFNERFKWVK